MLAASRVGMAGSTAMSTRPSSNGKAQRAPGTIPIPGATTLTRAEAGGGQSRPESNKSQRAARPAEPGGTFPWHLLSAFPGDKEERHPTRRSKKARRAHGKSALGCPWMSWPERPI